MGEKKNRCISSVAECSMRKKNAQHELSKFHQLPPRDFDYNKNPENMKVKSPFIQLTKW